MTATIGGEIERLNRLRPNAYEDEDKVGWLSALEGKIQAELLAGREGAGGEGFQGYDHTTPHDRALLIQGPYADIYLKWLMAQVDFHNLESDRYNAGMAAFNYAWVDLANWVNRTYRPRRGARLSRLL